MTHINLTDKQCQEIVDIHRNSLWGYCGYCGEEIKKHNLSDTRGTKLGCPGDEEKIEIFFTFLIATVSFFVGFGFGSY